MTVDTTPKKCYDCGMLCRWQCINLDSKGKWTCDDCWNEWGVSQ